jgi:hypothetical protein
MWRCAFDWSPVTSLRKSSASRFSPSSKGRVIALRTASTQAAGASRPRIGKTLADQLVLAIADAPQWPAFSHDAACESERPGGQIAVDDLFDDPVGLRFPSLDRIAGDDHLERLLGPDQARQSLGAASPGEKAELDLGQADARRRDGDTEMAGQCHLEPAPECRPVQCRDDRLWHGFYRADDLAEPWRLRRLAEFSDIGARKKGASGTSDHHRLDRRVVPGLAKRLGEPRANLVLERVDWRVVNGDDGDLAVSAEIDAGADIAHHAPRTCRIIVETSPPSPRDEERNQDRLSLTKIAETSRFARVKIFADGTGRIDARAMPRIA